MRTIKSPLTSPHLCLLPRQRIIVRPPIARLLPLLLPLRLVPRPSRHRPHRLPQPLVPLPVLFDPLFHVPRVRLSLASLGFARGAGELEVFRDAIAKTLFYLRY